VDPFSLVELGSQVSPAILAPVSYDKTKGIVCVCFVIVVCLFACLVVSVKMCTQMLWDLCEKAAAEGIPKLQKSIKMYTGNGAKSVEMGTQKLEN
jgi:hypothetical protein